MALTGIGLLRISAHRTRGGPWRRYRYAGVEPNVRVIEHTNEGGLGYAFQYKKEKQRSSEDPPRNSTTVTDSLGRKETYRYEGAAGLNRLIFAAQYRQFNHGLRL